MRVRFRRLLWSLMVLLFPLSRMNQSVMKNLFSSVMSWPGTNTVELSAYYTCVIPGGGLSIYTCQVEKYRRHNASFGNAMINFILHRFGIPEFHIGLTWTKKAENTLLHWILEIEAQNVFAETCACETVSNALDRCSFIKILREY